MQKLHKFRVPTSTICELGVNDSVWFNYAFCAVVDGWIMDTFILELFPFAPRHSDIDFTASNVAIVGI